MEARRGRLDALRVIQNTALGNEEEILGGWLTKTGLAGNHRLVQRLMAEPRWTRAVETVLGDFLQAVCVDDVSTYAANLPDATVVLLADSQQDGDAPADSLAARVQNSGPALPLARSPLRFNKRRRSSNAASGPVRRDNPEGVGSYQAGSAYRTSATRPGIPQREIRELGAAMRPTTRKSPPGQSRVDRSGDRSPRTRPAEIHVRCGKKPPKPGVRGHGARPPGIDRARQRLMSCRRRGLSPGELEELKRDPDPSAWGAVKRLAEWKASVRRASTAETFATTCARADAAPIEMHSVRSI